MGWTRRGWCLAACAALQVRVKGQEQGQRQEQQQESLEDEWRRIVPGESPERDPALAALLAEMKSIQERKDRGGLLRLQDADFRVEFQGGTGPEDFAKRWFAKKGSSALWDLLGRLLEMRGVFYSETLYVLPEVYANFPQDLDPSAHVVAVQATEWRAAAEAGDEVIPVPACTILPLAEQSGEPRGTLLVRHPQKGAGRVSLRAVYSPLAHRMFFEKRKGEWRWISLVSADNAKAPSVGRRAE